MALIDLGKPSAFWTYRDREGRPLFAVARYETPEGKTIRPWTWNGTRWVPKGYPAPRPLFGLELLAQAPSEAPVMLVEGEKTAQAARSLFRDYVVMCWPGGADGVRHADWSPLSGRSVVLVPDADSPGEKAMDEVAGRLEHAKCRISRARMRQDAPKGWDLADAMAEGWDAARAQEWLKEAIPEPVPDHGPRQSLTLQELVGLPPLRWTVKGVLPDRGLAVVYGAPGSGKSFLALDLCFAIARGLPWFGHRVRHGNIAYLAAEGGGGLAQRVRAYVDANELHTLPDALRILPDAVNLLDGIHVSEVIETIQKTQESCRLVVVDTMNRATPGMDENSPEDMGSLIASCSQIEVALKCIVLLVHHSGKDTARGARGHSSLRGAVDTEIEVSRPEGGGRTWSVAKQRDGEEAASIGFELRVVELGTDEDGDPVTSCVVAPTGEQVSQRGPNIRGEGPTAIVVRLQAAGGRMRHKDLLDDLEQSGLHRGSLRSALSRLKQLGIVDEVVGVLYLISKS